MRNSPVPPAILAHGLCVQPGGPDFFSPLPDDVRKAKNLCALCPVRFDCLKFAVTTPETYGVWGGADQWEIRIACAVTPYGEPVKKAHPAKCPYCRSIRNVTEVREVASRASRAHCTGCGLSWKRARSFVKKERARRSRILRESGLPDAA